MANILIGFFTVALLLLCAFIVLIILMQRPSANAGMGSALGGGAAESAFGGQTANVLTRATIMGAAAFFILCFVLYIAHMARIDASQQADPSYEEARRTLTSEAPETVSSEDIRQPGSLTEALEASEEAEVLDIPAAIEEEIPLAAPKEAAPVPKDLQ